MLTSMTSVIVASRVFKKDSDTNFFTYKPRLHTTTVKAQDTYTG